MTFAEYRLIIVEEDDSQPVELVGSGTKGLGVVQGVEVDKKQGDQGVECLNGNSLNKGLSSSFVCGSGDTGAWILAEVKSLL